MSDSTLSKTDGVPGKRVAVGRDWTRGNVAQNILLLSWPAIVLSVLYYVNLVLEMIWVGKLGAESIAGVGVGGFILTLVVTTKSSLSIGERAMVARFVGGGDVAAANRIAGQAFLISAVYGLIVTVIGILLTQPIFNLFGLDPSAVSEGVVYLRIILAGWITEAFWITSFSVMQASGDTIAPMKVAIFIRCVNAIVCPLLVLGWWIFPRLGVAGAAITYILVTGLGMCVSLWILWTGRTRLRLTWHDLRPDPALIWRILKIGLPASATGMGKAFGDLILTWLLIPFGTLALAAHNIISRIEGFINAPGAGLGTGASVLVGQNLGAGQPRQATRSGWIALGMVLGIMFVFAIALLVWSEKIIGLFTVDPDLIKLGSLFLRVAVAGYLGMTTVYLMQNCISGSGDTLPPMAITLAMLWAVQLPLAFLLSRHTDLGVYGIRWAIVISFVVGAIAYVAYFRLGRWKRKRV
jgi:putative MATE family efflux protein